MELVIMKLGDYEVSFWGVYSDSEDTIDRCDADNAIRILQR